MFLKAVMEYSSSAIHPAVIAHPVTGLPHLFVNPSDTVSFFGLRERESDLLLKEVLQSAFNDCDEVNVDWNVGDVLVFDNLALQHKSVDDFDARRVMRLVLSGRCTFRTSMYVDDVDGAIRHYDFIQLMKLYSCSLHHNIAIDNCIIRDKPYRMEEVCDLVLARNKSQQNISILGVAAGTGTNRMQLLKTIYHYCTKIIYLDDNEKVVLEAQRHQLYDDYCFTERYLNGHWPFMDASFDLVIFTTGLLRPRINIHESIARMLSLLKPDRIMFILYGIQLKLN